MRPLILTMQAFGSYGQKVTIDFRETSQNLFLITGDTGAGKTTIFDAIVFALYGEASSGSNKKDGPVLQSQYMGYDSEPYVELTFSEGVSEDADIYTVKRIPTHMRLLTRGKDKGSKTREVSGSVSLIMPDGTEYSAKNTNARLEEIIGLTKKQFMQVAMIAQGEFMELLRAKTDTKKEIFRKLFNTELFERISAELGKREKEKSVVLSTIRTECQTNVARMKVPEEYEAKGELEQLGRQITEENSLANIEKYMEGLEKLCDELKNKKNCKAKEEKEAEQIRDGKRDIYAKSELLLKLFGQLEKAEKDIADCKMQESIINELEELNKRLRLAYEIKVEYDKYIDAEKVLYEIKTELKNQTDLLPVLTANMEEASCKEIHAKEEYEKENKSYIRISERVETAVKVLKQMDAARKKCETDRKRLETVEKEEQRLKESLRNLEEKKKQYQAELEDIKNAEVLYEEWKAYQSKIEELEAEADELEGYKTKVQDCNSRYEEAKKLYKRSDEEYNVKKKHYDECEQAFMDNQAGVFVRRLVDGKPCPICGSLEHPAPYKCEEKHNVVSEDTLNEMKQALDSLRQKRETDNTEAHIAKERLEQTEKAMQDSFDKLVKRIEKMKTGEKCRITMDNLKSILNAWNKESEEQGEKLKKQVKRIEDIRIWINDSEKQQDLKNKELQEHQIIVKEANAEYESGKAALNSLENNTEYSSIEAAETARAATEKAKKDKEAVYMMAQDESSKAKSKKNSVETLIKRYRQELPEKEKICQERKASYKNVMEEKSFKEECDWKKLTEDYDKSSISFHDKQISDYKEKKTTAFKLKESAEKAIGDSRMPDMEAVDKERKDAEEWFETVKESHERYKILYKDNLEVYNSLLAKMSERREIIAEHNRIKSLYELVSGKRSGARMDLETYVQRYYLERVLYAANKRFSDMSSGQYELRMYDIEKAGEGKNKGLDLMVYSNVTGKEREIRTLSGGESFMAALSLALGMADQIQDDSSVINLDMMFIDEGFGSLDEHSRNQAVKVLKEMAGGTKLIGIISHVSELKQEIEDQLWVYKDDNGSNVKWHNS